MYLPLLPSSALTRNNKHQPQQNRPHHVAYYHRIYLGKKNQPVASSIPQPAAAAAAAQAPLGPPQSTGSGGAGTAPSTADLFASGPRLRPVSKVWGRPKPGDQPVPVAGGPPKAMATGATAQAEAAPVYPPAAGGGYGASRRGSSSAPVPQVCRVCVYVCSVGASVLFLGGGPRCVCMSVVVYMFFFLYCCQLFHHCWGHTMVCIFARGNVFRTW